ncbi:gas vesicle protein [Bacillus sp. AFS031507]|nr:gas vesicle protein [Bacillus sp. AFS031507]
MPIQHPSQSSSNLLEVLEKILDKGVVIAGDIKISLADVDLLTIKIRLLIASVDKAREIGMDWWEKDPYYSSKGRLAEKEHDLLLERINHIEKLVETKALPLEERASLEPINENILHQPDEMPMLDEEIEITKVEKTDSKKNGKKKDSQNKKNDSQSKKKEKKKCRSKQKE